MSKKKLLVTGGAGFIGSHLCEALVTQGHEVVCVDNFSTGQRRNIAHVPELAVVEADVNDERTWQRLSRHTFDVVFHYAATVGVRHTEENPQLVLNDVHGILHLMAFATRGCAKKVIFASSSEVYGDATDMPLGEHTSPRAWSPYTTVKVFGEQAMQTVWRAQQIPTVSLRFFNVYGPRQRGSSYGFVTARFIEQVLAGDSPTVFGDGSQTRDLVYIDDNVQAALAAMERPDVAGEIINVGSGRETAIIDLAQIVIESAGRPQQLAPVFLPKRTIEIKRRCAAVKKMHNLLGVTCSTSLKKGLQATIGDEAKVLVPQLASVA